MLSPYFCLKRPDPEEKSRLDKVLKIAADKGVKIFIMVYMEPEVAINTKS